MGTSTLLGHLAQFGSLGAQGELLCTQGLAYVLRTHQDARRAFAEEVEGSTQVQIGSSLTWRAEARQDDLGRPDLEARTPDGHPVVKVEAKLGADLAEGQLRSYLADLLRRDRPGALLVVVPAPRKSEAATVASRALGIPGPGPWPATDGRRVGAAVFTWDNLLERLGRGGSARLLHELEQLQSMYRVLSGGYMAPLAGIEALLKWRERESDFFQLVDRVTRRLSTQDRVYPMGEEPLEEAPGGLDARAYRRRYVGSGPVGSGSYFSIGTRDPFAPHATPIWLRFHRGTGNFELIRERVAGGSLCCVDSGGHLWIPLDPPSEASLDEMVHSLVQQAEEVLRVAFPGG